MSAISQLLQTYLWVILHSIQRPPSTRSSARLQMRPPVPADGPRFLVLSAQRIRTKVVHATVFALQPSLCRLRRSLFTFHCGAALDGLAARIRLAGRRYATTHPWATGKAARPPAGAAAPVVAGAQGPTIARRRAQAGASIDPRSAKAGARRRRKYCEGAEIAAADRRSNANAKRRSLFFVRWDDWWHLASSTAPRGRGSRRRIAGRLNASICKSW